MYQIITKDCPRGYGIVRDYLGNTWYYGSIDECKEFIKQMEVAND